MQDNSYALKSFSKTTISAALFQSNHYLSSKIIQYASEPSLNIPLLHTWSLSVEIQFYIIFPFVVWSIIYIFKKNFFLCFFTLAIISIIFAEFLIKTNPVLSFYLLPTRIFELMVGSMITLLEKKKEFNSTSRILYNKNIFYKKVSNYGSLFGACLLFYSILIFDEQTRHPSFITLLPVIGTGLLILFSRDNFMEKILSNKLIVSIGLISYSFYLWHFPIFSFPRALEMIDENNFEIKFILIIGSIILSILSYFLIEKPFRNKFLINSKTIYLSSFVSLILLISFSYYSWSKPSLINKDTKEIKKYPKIIAENINKASSWKITQDGLGGCYGRSKIYCNWNWGADLPRIYFVGDSHMSVLEKDIVDFAIENQLPIELMTGRFYMPDFKKYNKKNLLENKEYTKSIKNIENILTVSDAGTPAGGDIVIYGSYYSLYLKGDQYNQSGARRISDVLFQPAHFKHIILDKIERKKLLLEGIKNNINKILEKQTMILVYPIPEAGILVARKLMNKFIFNLKLNNNDSFEKFIKRNKYYITSPYEKYLERNEEIIELFDSINHPNLYKVYPASYFCDNQVRNKCITHDDTKVYYHDRHHLTPEGATIVNSEIIKILKKIYINY